MSASIRDYVNHNYKYQKASYAQAQAGVRADYQPQGWPVGCFGRVATAWQFCSEQAHEANVHLAVGIVF
jgi:hypothetical protein